MPEMPEVETMVSRLQRYVGENVEDVISEIPERYGRANYGMPGKKIRGIYRRGKYMIFMLPDEAILCHNAMSGYWDSSDDRWTFDYVEGKRESTTNDERAWITVNSDEGFTSVLIFHDARKFGSLKILSPEALAEKLSTIGPEADHTPNLYEPSDVMSPESFSKICDSKKTIKEVLMDQSKIAGVGNIYAAEALWYAGIDPHRVASTLPELGSKSRFDLFLSVRSVLRQALERRLNYDGLKVYRRKKCPVCDFHISVDKIKGRTTYWCAACQK